MDDSTKMLNKIYEKETTYYKIYGGSVYFCVILIFFLSSTVSFCSVWKERNSIKNDWENQKCSPYILPFAGYINAPPNTSATDFTLSNFTECVQSEIKSMTEISLSPATMLTDALNALFAILLDCINAIVAMIDFIRTSLNELFNAIYQFFIALSIPIVQTMYGVNSIMQRIMSIMYVVIMIFGLCVSVFQNLYGSAMEIFIASYIVFLAVFVALMFFLPFTLVAVVVMLVLLLVMLALIIIFMLFYETIFSALPMYVPGTPSIKSPSHKCFAKNTLLKLKNGEQTKIQKIKIGSILEDGGIVIAKLKISSHDVNMFDLNGVIVSESDYVSLTKYKNHNKNIWVQVKDHFLAKPVTYNNPYIYCLITSTKKIVVNNMFFLDWDNIKKLSSFKNKISKKI